MKNNESYDNQDIDALIRQIDALTSGDNLDPNTADDGEMTYNNYSNGYGQAAPAPRKAAEYRDYGGQKPSRAAKAAGRSRNKRRRKGGCGCATFLLIFAAMIAAALLFVGSFFEMPVSSDSIGARKEKTATILLCGTDKDGTRTDTMMLLYLDGKDNRVGLLSIPRDTLTRTGEGKRAKLNSAYGRNGCGEEGMEWTMTYIQRIIGYRPDGYILVDMELVPKIVDLMGGVDVHLDHHIRVHTDGVEVYVPKGDQHLNGEEVLATLRYRYGYADADLGRVKVQRMVIKECMKQWVSPTKLMKLPEALDLVQEESLTDLSISNFLWIGKTILTSMDSMTSDTLPGYADMRGGASYFVLYPEQVAELINTSYNPYEVQIDEDDLTIEE